MTVENKKEFFTLFCLISAFALCGQTGNVSLQVQGGQITGFSAISPDDRTVIAGSGEVIDVKKGVVLHQGLPLGKFFMMDDSRHLVSHKPQSVEVLDYLTNTWVKSLRLSAASDSYYSPVSRNGEWYVYLHSMEKAQPLTDETDAKNNLELSKHTGTPNVLHVIHLPEGIWKRSITTGFEEIKNYSVEGNRVAVLGYYAEKKGSFLKFFDLNDGRLLAEHKIADVFVFYAVVALSPEGDYFFAYGGGKENGSFMAIEVQTGKKLTALNLEDLEQFHAGEYKFSDDGSRLFLLSRDATWQNSEIKIVDITKDKVLFNKKIKGTFIASAISHDLKTGFLQYYTDENYLTNSSYLYDFDKKETPGFLLPSGNLQNWNSGRIFTHQGSYLIEHNNNFDLQKAQLTYYHYQKHRIEKVVPLLNQSQPTALSFHHATKDLYFTYNATAYYNGPIYKMSMDKVFGLSKVFARDSCGKYALCESRNLAAQGLMGYHYDSAGKKMKTKDDSLNNYRINASVTVKTIGEGKEIFRLKLPVGHVVEDLFFDKTGQNLAFFSTVFPHVQYKNGIPVTPKFDFTKQVNLVDIATQTMSVKLRVHPSDVLHTLKKNIPALILDESRSHTYLFGTGNAACQTGIVYTVENVDYKLSLPAYLIKVNIHSGKIVQCYGQHDYSQIDYVCHSDKYMVFRNKYQTDDKWVSKVVVLDYDLNPVLEIPIPQSSAAEGKIDDQNTRLILTVEAHKDYEDQKDHTSIYSLANGRLEEQFETPPIFQNEMIFTDHLCIFPNGIFDLKKKQTTLNWSIFNNNEFIATTPDHYYWAGKNLAEALRFTRKGNSLPFRQYDMLYNRPDKVLAALPDPDPALVEIYKKAYLKRLQKAGFQEGDLSADAELPILKIHSQNLPFETTQPQLALSVEASDQKYWLDRINVWVNDVPAFGKNGISLRGKNLKTWKETLNIPLSSGQNEIQISCLNEKGVESLLEDITINYKAPTRKPDLYLLAIGVSRYADTTMNLHYAARDAADVVTLFGSHKEAYNQVFVKQLTDAQVTKAQVIALKDWLKQSKTDDRVIVFVAGHGLMDANLDYYLATYDLDFNNPAAKGLPYDALDDLLDDIPARQKLILMDACHSGEIDKEGVTLVQAKQESAGSVTFRAFNTRPAAKQVGLQNSFELMKTLFVDLRRSSGATAISSAGGMEMAMEGDAWKNGVFTWCLKKGLSKSEADLNKDGAVMISELQTWLGAEVEKVTNGHQKPTFRAENVSNDWRVW